MTGPTPIPTTYAGIRFRSRLEARWAVFFDALGVRTDYEPEGYRLSDGTQYLPDFYVHARRVPFFAEIKPSGVDSPKARQFGRESGNVVWVLSGNPLPAEHLTPWMDPGYSPDESWHLTLWCERLGVSFAQYQRAHGYVARYCFWDPSPSRRAYA